MCCVRRCALHWREVCRRRRLARGLGDGVVGREPCHVLRAEQQKQSCDEWSKLVGYVGIYCLVCTMGGGGGGGGSLGIY